MLGWEVPVTWIGVVDGLLTIVGVMVANRVWIWQSRRGREPRDFAKIALGYAGIAAAYLFIAASAILPLVPVLLWIGFFVILDLSYGWIEPPIQSLVSRGFAQVGQRDDDGAGQGEHDAVLFPARLAGTVL